MLLQSGMSLVCLMNTNGEHLKYIFLLLILALSCSGMAQQSTLGILLQDTTTTQYSIFSIQLPEQKPLVFAEPVPKPEIEVDIPSYELGFFCKFEDAINRQRKFRIDFGTD